MREEDDPRQLLDNRGVFKLFILEHGVVPKDITVLIIVCLTRASIERSRSSSSSIH